MKKKIRLSGTTVCILTFILAVLFSILPVSVLAEDAKVQAVSPGYDIVVGPGVTFKWKDSATRKQRSYKLYTSERDVKANSSSQELNLPIFPFGSGDWFVKIYNCKNQKCWIGTTSKQNFYHYNNVSNTENYRPEPFEYKRGFRSPRRRKDYTVFFELTKDYKIDIGAYFLQEKSEFPKPLDGGRYDRTEEQMDAMYDHVKNLYAESKSHQSHAEPDFIKLKNGVLTLKKGYRWDGTSNPFVGEENSSDLRSSCIHDAMYDLMRMGYIEPQKGETFNWDDEGSMNRLVAV